MDLQKYYQIIGCDENVSDEELYQVYLARRTKYQNDRFLEGEAGNQAAKNLTALNEAYAYIVDYRKDNSSDRKASFSKVDEFLKAGKINEAQSVLDAFDERNAEMAEGIESKIIYQDDTDDGYAGVDKEEK